MNHRYQVFVIASFAAVVLHGCCAPSASSHCQEAEQRRTRRNANLIAHIEHDGLSFSISIDPRDDSLLKITIPEKQSSFDVSSRPLVRLKIVMRDDSIIQGVAKESPPWIGNGGWVDVGYQFALGRRVSVDDIHSVTIWIGDQQYAAFPF
jgi:hypothetical protein